jgi:hypothetical protein
MNSKRVFGRSKFQGPNQDDFRVSYSMEIEIEDDGDYKDNGRCSRFMLCETLVNESTLVLDQMARATPHICFCPIHFFGTI